MLKSLKVPLLVFRNLFLFILCSGSGNIMFASVV